MRWNAMVLGNAIRLVLSSPRRIAGLFVVAVGFFAVLVLIPVLTIPGNDVFFQLSITRVEVLGLMIALSMGNALVVMMQWHLYQGHAVAPRGRDVAADGGLLAGAVVATLACTACYSFLLALFGLTAVAFIAAHRILIAFIAVVLTVWALSATSRRIVGICTRCENIAHR